MHLLKYQEMLYIETSTSLGSLHKFEGASGELNEALGSRHPLISSPALMLPSFKEAGCFKCCRAGFSKWVPKVGNSKFFQRRPQYIINMYLLNGIKQTVHMQLHEIILR